MGLSLLAQPRKTAADAKFCNTYSALSDLRILTNVQDSAIVSPICGSVFDCRRLRRLNHLSISRLCNCWQHTFLFYTEPVNRSQISKFAVLNEKKRWDRRCWRRSRSSSICQDTRSFQGRRCVGRGVGGLTCATLVRLVLAWTSNVKVSLRGVQDFYHRYG